MTNSTQLHSEYSVTTENSDIETSSLRVVGSYTVASTTTDSGICQIVLLNQGRPRENVLPNHISIDALEARLLQIPGMEQQLREARPWVAQTLYPGRNDLRTLRLSKGFTQSKLASEIGTSQPHLARMEKGCADLRRDTMRRLCDALDVDMNTLDQALHASVTATEHSRRDS